MAPTVYKSSDTSAPVLTGQVGTLVALLDACLVNGYGSKSAAGWTKAFTATNKGSYLGTAGHYLDVDDSGAGAAAAQEANVRGYESMTAVGTGTAAFPTTAQFASPGLYVRKSAAADATARGWVLLADGTTFHLFVLSGDLAGTYHAFSFGRVYSFKSGDTYRSVIMGNSSTGGGSEGGLGASSTTTSTTGTTLGIYLPRVAAGTGTSINPGLFGFGGNFFVTSGFNGPNLSDGNIYLSRLFISDNATAANGLRGFVRGVYQVITGVTLNDGDTFTGTGDFASRTFIVLKKTRQGAILALETTAWDSSS